MEITKRISRQVKKRIIMSKQTAVEWLADNIHYLHSTKWNDIIQQAKEMEKQQIIDAYNQGSDDLENLKYLPFKYYNETFNKKI